MIEILTERINLLNEEIERKTALVYKENTELDKLLKEKAEMVNRKTALTVIKRENLYGRIIGDYLQHRGNQNCGYATYQIFVNDEVYIEGRLTKVGCEYLWEEKEFELNAFMMNRFFVEVDDFIITDLKKWKETVIAYEKGEKVEYKDINGQGLLKFKYE